MQFISKSPLETQKIAAKFAQEIMETQLPIAQVIALEGELGAGKTTFTQGFAESLGVPTREVKSPTFVVMKSYQLLTGRTLYHLDCYRMAGSEDVVTLGLGELFREPQNIILVEWANRILELLPPHRTVHIDHISEQERRISIK